VPLASVEQYVLGILDGLPIIGLGTELEAFITPPVVDNLDRPKAYIQGARLRTSRQTAPRRSGFKHLAWTVDVYLTYETNLDSPTVDTEFSQVIDAVMAAFWSTTIPTFIDSAGRPVPAAVPNCSQILNTGEDFELENPPEHTPKSLRMLYYAARLGVDIYEAVQA
jgi:hypothetical protein